MPVHRLTRECILGSREAFLRLLILLALVLSLCDQALPGTSIAEEDQSFEIYAVNVVKTPPFEKQFNGYGIFLAQGLVITAAHVVGHWPSLTHPRVVVAGQDLPATVIKKGSYETIDLALLSIDQTRLPVSLRLRRNPLCKSSPQIGMEVVDVIPGRTSRAHIISPLTISPDLRGRFDALTDSVETSGSGIFDPARKCLLGIASARVGKLIYLRGDGRSVAQPNGFAGYFVSAAKIIDFLPPQFRQ